uniref:Uncharacterized protein n=1 Tax=viral metagenome TaxID=1070528 RepID=A0A6C0AEM4_9ZZZZ
MSKIINSYELNRINISGEINESTPSCVIIEIAMCMNAKLDKNKLLDPAYIDIIFNFVINGGVLENDFKKISNIKIIKEYEDIGFKEEDLPYIASFVNPDSKYEWDLDSLILAFRHLLSFYKNIPVIEENFQIGQKNPNCINNYNSCMLYKLCTFNEIKTNRNMTLSEMARAVKFLEKGHDALRDNLVSIIENLHKNELINLIISNELKVAPTPKILPPIQKKQIFVLDNEIKTYDFEKLVLAYNDLTNMDKLFSRIEPASDEESIILAALMFYINLTECSSPYQEFMEMKKNSNNNSFKNPYIPIDKYFKKKYLINPDWYDIKKTWTDKIPSIYDDNSVRIFAEAEGYKEDLEKGLSPLEVMRISRTTRTFYLGEHPDIKQNQKRQSRESSITSIDMDTGDDHDRKLILSFGIAEDSIFQLYKISELIDYFKNTNSFNDPFDNNEQISTHAINKLKNIASEKIKHLAPSPNKYDFENAKKTKNYKTPKTIVESQYLDLYNLILKIEKDLNTLSPETKNLKKIYKSNKTNINTFFNKILEMGYYMRGWKIKTEELPIEDTTYPEDKQGDVYINVTNSINNFNSFFQEIPIELKNILSSLQLMKAKKKDGDITLIKSTSSSEGLTILRRIEIVSQGENEIAGYSCIRLSSNFLLSSVYYYMEKLGLELPFDIKQLRQIS